MADVLYSLTPRHARTSPGQLVKHKPGILLVEYNLAAASLCTLSSHEAVSLVGLLQLHNMTFLQNSIFTPPSSPLLHKVIPNKHRSIDALRGCLALAFSRLAGAPGYSKSDTVHKNKRQRHSRATARTGSRRRVVVRNRDFSDLRRNIRQGNACKKSCVQ